MTHNPIQILSLGAGVQSSTIAMMAAFGEIAPPDCAIFADTGEEPKAVYEHLAWLMEPGRLPFPVHIVRAWDGYGKPRTKRRLGDEILAATRGEGKTDSHARPPFFTLDANGKKGMIRRQCTGDYKIDPINRKVREILGLKPGQKWPNEIRVCQWIGISTDEISRQKPIQIRRVRNGQTVSVPHPTILGRWPLIDLDMSREDCLRWWTNHGFPQPPKSACTFCPYHSNAEWRKVRSEPNDWARVVEIDRAIRSGLTSKHLSGSLSLHRDRKAIDEIDFSERTKETNMNLWNNECEGMCGV